MSFVMLYQLPRSETNRYFYLMGLVGKDSQLYWKMSDVHLLAPSTEGIHFRYRSSVRVRDVVGIAAARLGEKPFLRQRVLTHLQTCKALRKARRKEVRRFGRRLNCPRTWVHEAVRNGDLAAPWQEPSLIRMLDKKEVDIEKHQFFYVWFSCFRQRVTEAVYGLNLVNGLSLPELFGGDEEKEAKEKPQFVFPGNILLKHGDETVRYVREPV